jgi:Tfp pilus assembly protein PilF
MPTAAHFLYIPAVLLLGIVIGWILGSRAAADAYASQLRRSAPNSQPPTPKKNEPS